MDAHQRLDSAHNTTGKRREKLQRQMGRIKELYKWGHMSREQYITDFNEVQSELAKIKPIENDKGVLKKLANFLGNIANAWKEANQEQRNKLAGSLFEQIRVEGSRVVLVKPKPELEPFFRLNFECHARNIGCDPGGIRTPDLHRDRVACLSTTPRGHSSSLGI